MDGIKLFSIIEDQVVLRNSSGVYRQVKLARRGAQLYAAVPGGFIRLYANKTTSSPKTCWDYIENQESYAPGKLGALEIKEGASTP